MKRSLTLLVLLALLVAVLPTPVAAGAESRSYLILAEGNKLPKKLANKVADAGGTLTRTVPEIGIAVATSSDPDFATQAAKIKGLRSVVLDVKVQWIEPFEKEAIEVEVGNPPFSGDDDFYFDLQWGHDAVDAPEAWDAGALGAGVRVAVLDTGFDLDHVDLAPNINYALSANFVPSETLWYALPDPFSHGSHTAGTIAAADNGFGTIGVAPEAELVLVKVLSDAGSGAFSWVIAGIMYAADVDTDIINMSLGATLSKHGFIDDDTGEWVSANEVAELRVALGRATTYAYQQGTTVIASAGNDARDGDHDKDMIHLPSDSPHVISVAATAPYGWAVDFTADLDEPAHYSNYGQSVISFAAPGGDWDFSYVPEGWNLCVVGFTVHYCFVFDYVFSTGSNLDPMWATYFWGSGTSMAAPHVCGVAAIIIGENGGDMHPAQVEAALRKSADDLGKPGNDDYYGRGRVNAYNAVK